MNGYLKSFLHRGLIFGGFGPVIMGIIYMILGGVIEDFSLNGQQVFVAIISTYLLAFIQAGASVFNQIENWPIAKSLLFHFTSIYIAYLLYYVVNTWIPFDPLVIVIFTVAFTLTYLIIWLSVFFAVKSQERSLNSKISE